MNFKENESTQKLRGGYYTPSDLAAFLVSWVREIRPGFVLEPSCGDGVFFNAMSAVGGFADTEVLGFELEQEEAVKARSTATAAGLTRAEVRPVDFLEWALTHMQEGGRPFDAVLGNPPFVRYQYLPEPFQARAEQIFKKLDLKFTKHTNAWVPFILASVSFLRPGGRLAMVVPSEIIHVTHAQSLRTFLGSECSRIVIVDPEELWFEGTLQGAVILMAEKKAVATEPGQGVGIHAVKGREFLQLPPSQVFNAPQTINGRTVAGKWTRALLDARERDLIGELAEREDVFKFTDVAQVDVGIVTGANKFFLVSDEVVNTYDLRRWAHPMFGRSEHCPGIIYDQSQHATNAAKGSPTNFLWFRRDDEGLDDAAEKYIEFGELQKLQSRYKCRVRSPWYTVPSVYSTEIGMLKRSHHMPRLIHNQIGAYTTDTAYRIRTHGVSAEKLVGSFINPLTALSAELEGRHYGGGVLELVPSEIEKLLIPLPRQNDIDLRTLDSEVRSLSTEAVLERQGNAILGALGIADRDQNILLGAWKKMRDRRHRTSDEADEPDDAK